MELWSSRVFTKVSEMTSCPEVNEQGQKKTETESDVIAACGSGLFYIVILFLSILGVYFRPFVRLSSSQGTFLVFIIGAMVASVNVFTNSDNLKVKLYFRIPVTIIIGIAYTVFGALCFFSRPGQQTNEATLGRQQPSMGLVVGTITCPLILIEIVLIISTQASKNANPSSSQTFQLSELWTYVLLDKSLYLAQKFFQAVVYIYLRNTITRLEYNENALFYFRIMSFFNFIEWVDAQVNAESDLRLTGVEQKLDSWFDFFVDLYKALIIDYRLSSCLLFLEHSLEIQTDYNGADDQNQNPRLPADDAISQLEGPATSYMPPGVRQLRALGYLAGLVCLIPPVVCGLSYVKNLHVQSWVYVFPIIVNVVIVSCGIWLLCANDLEEGDNNEATGVKFMVSCLGAVGFTCWMAKSAIISYWAATAYDGSMVWAAAKYTIRGLITAFLMGLFLKVNARALPIRNPNRTMNHFLVPLLMLGILSVFPESLVDQYFGPLENRIRCEIKEQSLTILLELGPPMYLGFLIHVCLHFVIIETKIGTRALPQDDGESSIASSYRTAL